MIYDLDKDFDKVRFKKRTNKLYEGKKVVSLEEKTLRTKKQNSYLHLIITFFAIETGNTIAYTKKEYYKKEANRELYVYIKRDNILNKDTERVRSSKDLTKEQMTLSIERFRNWSSENGYYLPSADEKEFLQNIEIEKEKHKYYL